MTSFSDKSNKKESGSAPEETPSSSDTPQRESAATSTAQETAPATEPLDAAQETPLPPSRQTGYLPISEPAHNESRSENSPAPTSQNPDEHFEEAQSVAKQSPEQPPEQSIKQSVELPTEQPLEQLSEQPSEQISKRAPEQTPEQLLEHPLEQTVTVNEEEQEEGFQEDSLSAPPSAEDPEQSEQPQMENHPAVPESGDLSTESTRDITEEQEEHNSAREDGEDELEEEKDSEDDEDEDEDEEDRPMTLRDHLTELRKRLTRAFLFMLAGFFICYPFAVEIYDVLVLPLQQAMPQAMSSFIFTSPAEAFFTYMKVAFVAGIFIMSPFIFYQVWAFIAPGLYASEKMYVLPIAVFSAVFFCCGAAFCYFVAFPFAFEFFMSYTRENLQAMLKVSETLNFTLQLLLAFGLVFELPLFVFFLARIGVVTAAWMRSKRRYAVLVNVILAAILTPPDVISQMLMAIPLLLLYECSILVAAVFGKKKPEKTDEENEEDGQEESSAEQTVPETAIVAAGVYADDNYGHDNPM